MLTLDRIVDLENMKKYASIWEQMPLTDKATILAMFEQDKSIDYYCGFLAAFSAVFYMLYDSVSAGKITTETVKKVINGSICHLSDYIIDKVE